MTEALRGLYFGGIEGVVGLEIDRGFLYILREYRLSSQGWGGGRVGSGIVGMVVVMVGVSFADIRSTSESPSILHPSYCRCLQCHF